MFICNTFPCKGDFLEISSRQCWRSSRHHPVMMVHMTNSNKCEVARAREVFEFAVEHISSASILQHCLPWQGLVGLAAQQDCARLVHCYKMYP